MLSMCGKTVIKVSKAVKLGSIPQCIQNKSGNTCTTSYLHPESTVRTIAMNGDYEGLTRGQSVIDTGSSHCIPVSAEIFRRIILKDYLALVNDQRFTQAGSKVSSLLVRYVLSADVVNYQPTLATEVIITKKSPITSVINVATNDSTCENLVPATNAIAANNSINSNHPVASHCTTAHSSQSFGPWSTVKKNALTFNTLRNYSTDATKYENWTVEDIEKEMKRLEIENAELAELVNGLAYQNDWPVWKPKDRSPLESSKAVRRNASAFKTLRKYSTDATEQDIKKLEAKIVKLSEIVIALTDCDYDNFATDVTKHNELVKDLKNKQTLTQTEAKFVELAEIVNELVEFVYRLARTDCGVDETKRDRILKGLKYVLEELEIGTIEGKNVKLAETVDKYN